MMFFPRTHLRFLAVLLTLLISFLPPAVIPDALAAENHASERISRALQANSAGNYDEAISLAGEAIQADPGDPYAYNARGLALYNKGGQELYEKAIRDYDMAISLKPDYAVAYMNRGNAKLELGWIDGVIEDQTKAIQWDPGLASAYITRGGSYHRKKMYEKAIEDYTRSIAIKGDDFMGYRCRGNSYFRSERYDLAIRDYDEAIRLAPQNAELYKFRGRTYLKMKDHAKALADLDQALLLKADDASALSYKGDVWLAQGQWDLAIQAYGRSIELNPRQKDLNSYFGRAKALREKGASVEAVEDLKKAVENAPDNGSYRNELAVEAGDQAVLEALDKAPSDHYSPETGTSSPSSLAQSPSGVSPMGARVLTPFSGYATADLCEQAHVRLLGVPWSEGEAASGTVAAAQLGQYQSMLRHTMQGLRVLYGEMTREEEDSFNAFWAPFFDHPTPAALDYFSKITPLLDEMAVTLSSLDGTLPQLGEALQGTLITAADPESGAPQVADAAYRKVKEERAKLDELARQITALGNPPNPLASKCEARKRHKKAMGGGPDIVAAVKAADLFHSDFYMQFKTAGSVLSQGDPSRLVEWDWDGLTFRISEQHNGPDFNYNSPSCDGTKGSSFRHEATGTLSADGKMLEKVSYRSFSKYCDYRTKAIVGPKLEGACEAIDIPLVSAEIEQDKTKIIYEVKGPDVKKHSAGVTGGLDHDYQKEEQLRFVFMGGDHKVTEQQAKAAVADIAKLFAELNGQGASSVPAVKGPESPDGAAQQTGKKKTAAADPEKDPQVIAEAIAQHQALAEQIRRDAARWASDADREKDLDRKKELLKRAGEMRANAQAEQDIADSIRTGKLVHTRTDWDEQQHQNMVNSVKKEIAVFEAQNRILANIPKVGDMIAGAEGVEVRSRVQQRISEAIKSPDALQKLAAIYGELQNKVIAQGERQMAAEQEKVAMWDRRVAIAEGVQAAASTGIMLGAMWAPAVVGSLALGYAGATGYAEGGVKGAAVAVVRSVSSKADVVISAYEGATKIDPSTGKPAGVWGAMEGALWAIGTDKGMQILGKRIQKAKTQYAAMHQSAGGGTSSKPVARPSGEGRLKEYDFKTPEERYRIELDAAKTPAQKEAVNKKHAIQVEREAMHRENEAALKKAEDAVRQGEDPAKAKEAYNRELDAIHKKYEAKETRNQEHRDVMKALGFDPQKDMKSTGSDPKTAASDMDLTPQGATPHEAYQKGKKYTQAMKDRGHHIVEYGDRWVDATTDTTVWKPGFGTDKPGSSSFEAEVIFGTLPHSDKFGTKGGIEWTSSADHTTADPLGAVLANAGKAVGAGLGNSRTPDLHTVGKSAVKAAEAAGITADPELKQQIEALKAHKTPEQAGVVDLGADPATKERQIKTFLGKVQTLMGQAYTSAKTKSDQNLKAMEQQAKAAGESDEGYKLRARVKAYRSGNDAALTTISQVSPGLAAQMEPSAKASDLVPAISSSSSGDLNTGGLARGLFEDRELASKAPPLPADSKDPAFAGLGERCKEGAKKVEEKLKAAKPGTDEAKYLSELKTALEKGEHDPAEAVRTVRGISGTELAAVLAQLDVPRDLNKKPAN